MWLTWHNAWEIQIVKNQESKIIYCITASVLQFTIDTIPLILTRLLLLLINPYLQAFPIYTDRAVITSWKLSVNEDSQCSPWTKRLLGISRWRRPFIYYFWSLRCIQSLLIQISGLLACTLHCNFIRINRFLNELQWSNFHWWVKPPANFTV